MYSSYFIFSRSKCRQPRTLTSTETSQSLTIFSLVDYNLQFYIKRNFRQKKKSVVENTSYCIQRPKKISTAGEDGDGGIAFFAHCCVPPKPLCSMSTSTSNGCYVYGHVLSLPVPSDLGLSQPMLRPCIVTLWPDMKMERYAPDTCRRAVTEEGGEGTNILHAIISLLPSANFILLNRIQGSSITDRDCYRS